MITARRPTRPNPHLAALDAFIYHVALVWRNAAGLVMAHLGHLPVESTPCMVS